MLFMQLAADPLELFWAPPLPYHTFSEDITLQQIGDAMKISYGCLASVHTLNGRTHSAVGVLCVYERESVCSASANAWIICDIGFLFYEYPVRNIGTISCAAKLDYKHDIMHVDWMGLWPNKRTLPPIHNTVCLLSICFHSIRIFSEIVWYDCS